MWEDPIVADVHRIREQLSAAYGFDVNAIFADLRKRQSALGTRLVPQKKRGGSGTEVERGNDSSTPGSTQAEAAQAS
jgi:hypothetical protein